MTAGIFDYIIIIIVIGAMLGAGLLALLMIKGKNIYSNKREYLNIRKHQSEATHSEPSSIYRCPITADHTTTELIQLYKQEHLL
jgi:hypothetical protein